MPELKTQVLRNHKSYWVLFFLFCTLLFRDEQLYLLPVLVVVNLRVKSYFFF